LNHFTVPSLTGHSFVESIFEPRENARPGSLEILVKDRQSGALFSRCKAKSFGRKLDATFLAATRRLRKTVPDRL
jgi:hypothetical protein